MKPVTMENGSEISPPAPPIELLGLTSKEADSRLQKFGPNNIADVSEHALRRALDKFWAPVPWMLEGAIALELVLGKYFEASVIAILLIFNAALAFLQEGRAQGTLAALKSRLAITTSVLRDSVWKLAPADELTLGDIVKLTLGGLVPADACLRSGDILVDQSMLTGKSAPVEVCAGGQVYAGALIRRGEAVAEVIATGAKTKFGQAAELVRTAHVVSSQQQAVFRVVRNLAAFNGVFIVAMAAYAYFLKMPPHEIIPLVLTAILASIPVALPATFTLAASLGARNLAKLEVLPTRLSAVDEAGTMDILCADKTGTLTKNELTVGKVRPADGFDEAYLLSAAACASADGGQDPVDIAIRSAAAKFGNGRFKVVDFSPFDPTQRMSAATVVDAKGRSLRIVKGAFATVSGLTGESATALAAARDLESEGLGNGRGRRTADGDEIGRIDCPDRPAPRGFRYPRQRTARPRRQGDHGFRRREGDRPRRPRLVGISGALSPEDEVVEGQTLDDYGVFAGVLPEDKFKLVKRYQRAGHTVGMCGDGADDAPALRQAQIGIAVSTATDVAKSAAGVVLTTPGLGGIVSAVRQGRAIYQRVLTYTLNSITKKIVQVLFIAVGLIITGHAILTPLLMAFIMIVGDFLGMSLTTDNVKPSPTPNSWKIGKLTIAGVIMGLGQLGFSVAVLAAGYYGEIYDIATMQTLAFVTIVCGNQATTYNNRERNTSGLLARVPG